MRAWVGLSATFAAGIAIFVASIVAATDWTVSLQGAGSIRFGMTLPEVRQVLGDRAAYLEGTPGDLEACSYLASKAVPKHLTFLFAGGRVVRVDVTAMGIHTARGAGVGDAEAKIKGLYKGQITVEPHPYDPDKGHFLNYWPEGGKHRYGMVFESDGEKVTSYRAGTGAAIALIEGCD